MESLSTAASVIGIISISFEYSRISISYDSLKPRSESFGHLAQLRPTITKVRNSLSNLTLSMEKLCDILQMIKIKPRNVMQPLPVQEELAFDQCASDLIKLESLVRRISQETVHTGNPLMNSMRGYPMVLRDGHVEEMQDILETHIKALEPLARMPSIVSQPTGSEHLTTVSKRLMDEICSANFIHYSDLTTSNSVRLRDNEGRKALASDRQDDFPSRVKNAMQRLHTEDITFSRLQLYSLLCLLIEINGLHKDDEEVTDDQEEDVSQEDTEYKAFKRQSHMCLRQLANLAKTKLTRSRPSPEARNIILTLKEFIWEVEIRSDPQNNNSISLVGKRKVEAGSMSEIARDGNDLHKFKRARRINVGYQWPSMTTRKSPREVQLCGRLANEDS